MTKIVDFSFAHEDPGALRNAGYVGVARYLAYRSGSTAAKVLTGQELAALHAAGLPVAVVWEVGTDWTSWNGAEADRQVAEFGFPPDRPIYWAVDRDITPGQYPIVGQFLDGVNSGRLRGIYGEADLVQWCIDNGHAAYGWIAGAYGWTGAKNADQARAKAPSAHLLQLVGAPISGTDENVVLKDDWGQWPLNGVTPGPVPAPIPSHQEDFVAALVSTPSDGKVWLWSAAGRLWITDPDQELPLTEFLIVRSADITTLTPAQEVGFKLVNEIGAPVPATIDTPALAAAIAERLSGGIQHLNQPDLDAVAKAVNDEIARRQAA